MPAAEAHPDVVLAHDVTMLGREAAAAPGPAAAEVVAAPASGVDAGCNAAPSCVIMRCCESNGMHVRLTSSLRTLDIVVRSLLKVTL